MLSSFFFTLLLLLLVLTLVFFHSYLSFFFLHKANISSIEIFFFNLFYSQRSRNSTIFPLFSLFLSAPLIACTIFSATIYTYIHFVRIVLLRYSATSLFHCSGHPILTRNLIMYKRMKKKITISYI